MANNIFYKKLYRGDEKTFYELVLLFNEVFKTTNDVNQENIKRLLHDPNFVCFTAIHDHEVIGGVTAYELLMYDMSNSAMFVYDLAVRTTHQ